MTDRNIRELTTATAYDRDGDKLGSVKEVYINDTTGQPDFVEVGHGLFGLSSSLVPLRGHRLEGEDLKLAFTKDRIKDAPDVSDDAHLTPSDQEAIYRHYGLEGTENVESYRDEREELHNDDLNKRQAGLLSAGPETRSGHPGDYDPPRSTDTQGASTDTAGTLGNQDDRARVGSEEGGSLTRSEERVKVDKERVNTGEARLRKYVVHDTETVEVPVEREEVHVERKPVDPDTSNRPAGRELSEDETSVTLHEDRVNVTKTSEPVEEVRLAKDRVTDTEQVTEDVAKERIEADVDDVDGPAGKRP